MKNLSRLCVTSAIIVCLPALALSQGPAPGLPLYGSFDGDKLVRINLQNLNVNVVLPISSSPARGFDSNFAISYNSSMWYPSGSFWYPVLTPSGSATWGWNNSYFVGVLYSRSTRIKCGSRITDFYTHYFGFKYVAVDGTIHPFNVSYTVAGSCGTTGGSKTGYATDNSGFYLDAGRNIVRDRSGQTISPFLNGSFKDTNGNYLIGNVNSGNASEIDWTDSRGSMILKSINNPSGPNQQFQFPDSTGTFQTTTLNESTLNIQTNFACSGIGEYSATATLPISLVMPNQRGYSFLYEHAPGAPSGTYTGRIQQILLPGNGYIQFQYSGANDGTNCSDGSALQLTIIRNDGISSQTTTYSRTQVNGNWQTTITYPQMPYDSAANQVGVTFNSSGQEISRQIYQGSASSPNLLRTINTTWAANGTPASQTTILEDGSTATLTETSYDTFGNLLSMKEHDWGTVSTPGAVLKNSVFTYLSTSAYTNLNILNLLTDETIANASGTVSFRKHIDYDNPGSLNNPCPTGVPGHDDTNYGCSFTTRGDPTAVTTYSDASTPAGPVTKNIYYDVFGNVVQAGLDCCQTRKWNFSATTQYSFPDSIVSGPAGGPQLTTSTTYNPDSSTSTTTDENGKTTSYTYDTTGRIKSITRPDQKIISYSYADSTNAFSMSVPVNGSSTNTRQLTYDGLGRITKATVLDGTGKSYQIVETQYDPLGRGFKVSNPHNSTAQYWSETRFDALGRTVKTIFPDGSLSIGSYSGNTVTTTDPAGKQRKTRSDGLGRLAMILEPDPSNNNSLTLQTSYTYTVFDTVALVTQGVQTRTYLYDGLNRLTSITTPESGHIANQYNGYSLLTQRTDARGVITNYQYDSLNRLTAVSYTVPNGSGVVPMPNVCTPTGGTPANVCWAYGTSLSSNNNGRLISMTDALGSESYTYDTLGQLTNLQKIMSGSIYSLAYTYNLAGEVTQITYPSGHVVQQSFDAIGRLCEIAPSTTGCGNAANPYATGYGYNIAGQVAGFKYGNGLYASFGFSSDRLLLTCLDYSTTSRGTNCAHDSTTKFGLDYTYASAGSNNGQISGITDRVDSGRSANYTYDALYRLTSAVTAGSTTYPAWGLAETYDRYGNRSAQSIQSGCSGVACPTNSVTVSVSTNQISGSPYAYDLGGNMTNDGSNTLVYDAENRAVSAANGGSAGAYIYDGNGLRVKKCVPNCSSPTSYTVYVFSGSKVIAEYDNGAAVTTPSREYIYSGGALLAKIIPGATSYYHLDHLSNRIVTDSTGNTVGQMGHFPFGESWYNAANDKLLFTTYERDSESGNDYALARYSVNRLGRFLSPDAHGGATTIPLSLNLYSYVENDPINNADPSGLVRTPWGFAFGGVDFGSNWSEFDLLEPRFVGDILRFAGPTSFHFDQYNTEGLLNEAMQGEVALVSVTPIYASYLLGPSGQMTNPSQSGNTSGDKKRDLIRAALSEKNLSKCLNEFFGPGTILTNENLPRIDAGKDLPGATAGRTDARQVPDTGRGTVQIDRGFFNSLPANDPFLTGTYLHETANVLAIQRFTDIQPRAARMTRGPLGGAPSAAQAGHPWDRDIGEQFEECLRRK